MAKPLAKGEVKTRLAAETNDEFAFNIYSKLLDYTLGVASESSVSVHMFFSRESDYTRDFTRFPYSIQKGSDLGERMQKAFEELDQNDFGPLIMIGSDCPDLRSSHITDAIKKLRDDDLVFGPSEDGGYYLLGLKKVHSFLFEDKPWSTRELMNITIKQAEEKGLKISCLETLNDIDTLSDLQASNWRDEIKQNV
jgi:rSAM/selenodomain-associated transferase 1